MALCQQQLARPQVRDTGLNCAATAGWTCCGLQVCASAPTEHEKHMEQVRSCELECCCRHGARLSACSPSGSSSRKARASSQAVKRSSHSFPASCCRPAACSAQQACVQPSRGGCSSWLSSRHLRAAQWGTGSRRQRQKSCSPRLCSRDARAVQRSSGQAQPQSGCCRCSSGGRSPCVCSQTGRAAQRQASAQPSVGCSRGGPGGRWPCICSQSTSTAEHGSQQGSLSSQSCRA